MNKEVNSYFSNFRCRISSVVVSVSKSTTLTAANGRATSTCRSANPCTVSGTRRAPCPTPTPFPLLHLQVRKYSRSISKTFIRSFPFYYFIAQVDGSSLISLCIACKVVRHYKNTNDNWIYQHRCTVVGNPGGGGPWFFLANSFEGGTWGFEKIRGGVMFCCIFMWKIFKNLYRGYTRCPLSPPVCIYDSMTTSTKLKDQFESTLCNKQITHFS